MMPLAELSHSLRAVRFFYFAYFAAMALVQAYLPLFFQYQGFDIAAIGLLLALIALAKMFAPPLFASLMDHLAERQSYILFLAALLAAVFSLFLAISAHILWQGFCLLGFAVLWSAILPASDHLALRLAEQKHVHYGRLRMWGAIGFLCILAFSGFFLADDAIVLLPYALFLCMLVVALSAKFFPVLSVAEAVLGQTTHFSKTFIILMIVCFGMQVSHGAYYGLFSLYLADQGYHTWQIGFFWAIGILAEIAFMATFSSALQKQSASVVLMICLWLAAWRWWGLSFASEWWSLAFWQVFHAASFAAFHLTAVHEAKRLAPAHRSVMAQAWYSSIGFGLGSSIGVFACALLADQWGYNLAFMACSVVALCTLLPAFLLAQKP